MIFDKRKTGKSGSTGGIDIIITLGRISNIDGSETSATEILLTNKIMGWLTHSTEGRILKILMFLVRKIVGELTDLERKLIELFEKQDRTVH
jgi:hypothetical protein